MGEAKRRRLVAGSPALARYGEDVASCRNANCNNGVGRKRMRFGFFDQLPCAPGHTEQQRYRDIIAQIELGDTLGFDTVWLGELHFSRGFSVLADPLVVLAAAAQRTRRIRLGTAVTLLPLHHPAKIAEEAAITDILSDGRLELGVGRGTAPLHYTGYGIPQEESRARFEEALNFILAAWTNESFSFNGKYFRAHDLRLTPRPLQQPHPPIRIAANSPDTFPFAAERRLPIFATPMINPPDKLKAGLAIYRAGLGAARCDTALAFPVHVAASREAARADVEPGLMRFLREATERLRPLEQGDVKSFEAFRQVLARMDRVTFADMDREMGVFGDPAYCIERVKELKRDYDMDEFICYFNQGGLMPPELVRQSMTRFASEVMPHCR